jgi:hypothetical protein
VAVKDVGLRVSPPIVGQDTRVGPAEPRRVAAEQSVGKIQPVWEDPRVHRDLKILARFVGIYCHGLHGQATREPLRLWSVDMGNLAGRPLVLCAECRRLLSHAIVKRAVCPFDPKPACKWCPRHCYAPQYRDQIRQVMHYAGKRLLFSGRLDYLVHLFF